MYIRNTATTISRFPLFGKCSSLSGHSRRGFALVVTISLMILLMLLAVAMLSLSTVTMRSSNTNSATNEARANARMALMIAIGELQKEMGPDMRISAEAAIYDTNPATEQVDGVAQPHWLAAYDSWGNFLNGEYTPEGKSTTEVRNIADTYVAKRAPMFRRWLVSLPESLKNDVNAADTKLNDEDTVLMVGAGTLGEDFAAANPNKVTRAYKIQTENSGSFAWWISPENHKAKIGLAAQKRELSTDQWASAQGVSSEVGIGGINGLETLDSSNANAASMANRIISFKTLELSGADEESAKSVFFDLTEVSSGVLSNTRSGGLKKDLSLLFEKSNTTIAPQYTQASRFAPEPSIRPHSRDILAKNADLPRRPFASWSNMRHYYRMYRKDTDSAFPKDGHGGVKRELQISTGKPYAVPLAPYHTENTNETVTWAGENAYHRFPIISKYLIIHAYKTAWYDHDKNPATPERLGFYHYDTPVVTFWNPYNTPLIINSDMLKGSISSRSVWPHRFVMYSSASDTKPSVSRTSEASNNASFATETGKPIVFEPGALKVFSFRSEYTYTFGAEVGEQRLYEGFDPSAALGGSASGMAVDVTNKYLLDITFDFGSGIKGRPMTGNMNDGNVPGSLSLKNVIHATNNFWGRSGIPAYYQVDWFQKKHQFQSLLAESGGMLPIIESDDLLPVAYSLFTLKSVSQLEQAASWAQDWRIRNWLHAPAHYYGSGLFMTEDSETRAHTQRLDSPYVVSYGPTSPSELIKLTGEINNKQWLGFGSNPYEKVTAAATLELPSAPLSSLASFSGMRMSPGFIHYKDLTAHMALPWRDWKGFGGHKSGFPADAVNTMYNSINKLYAYQSGMTGPGIGNSFVHPMIPRDEVYHKHDNSVSHVQKDFFPFGHTLAGEDANAIKTVAYDTKAYSDYWDHVLMLNDSLWDDYFISSIADQTRPWASESDNLQANIETLTANEPLPISRYQFHDGGMEASEVKDKLNQEDAYLRVAEHLTVDGAFNVNSTSVNAWYAMFKGIRERKLFYRNTSTGALEEVTVPSDHIALSRFDTPTTDQEATDLSSGVAREDGHMAWSGVRFLDDNHIRLLAEKCVEQVKRRGPFLNFSEFINRRLENSQLGLMGALQSAIDFDDASPQSGSINHRFKSTNNLRISPEDLGSHEYPTPEAVEGSRLAGIPGYVIQSDLLKPIANTLQVRDDTFRIRAYGEALDAKGIVIARAWCEAIVQRNPEYVDPTNSANEPAFVYEGNPPDSKYDPKWNGEFTPNTNLTATNRRFGRKFEIKSFRWLASEEL